MTEDEAKQEAQTLIASGLPPEDIIAGSLLAVASLEEKLEALIAVTSIDPIIDNAEKQKVLNQAVLNGCHHLYAAFHACGIKQEINAPISTPDGAYVIIFKRNLLVG